MYKRKTYDLFTIQTLYSNQWEDVTASLTRKEAIEDLKAYRLNQPEYIHRLIVKREYI